MNASILQHRGSQPVWSGVAIWLAALLSPTIYFLTVLLSARFRTNLPQTFIWSLFFLIPVGALLICEWVVWSGSKTVGRKIGWTVFTLLAMSVQFALILVVLRVILVTAISYAQ